MPPSLYLFTHPVASLFQDIVIILLRFAMPTTPIVAGAVGDHLLERYRASFAALLKAQFTSKRLPDGRAGVEALTAEVCSLLCRSFAFI